MSKNDRNVVAELIAELIESGLSDEEIAETAGKVKTEEKNWLKNSDLVSIIRDLMVGKPDGQPQREQSEPAPPPEPAKVESRFSPNNRRPQSAASRMASGGLVFDTASRRT